MTVCARYVSNAITGNDMFYSIFFSWLSDEKALLFNEVAVQSYNILCRKKEKKKRLIFQCRKARAKTQ